jgi:hypothetical protein
MSAAPKQVCARCGPRLENARQNVRDADELTAIIRQRAQNLAIQLEVARRDLATARSALEALAAIGEALATQDNRLTGNPIFVVQRSRRTYGFDTNYTEDCIAWLGDDHIETKGAEYEALEAKWEETGDEPDGYTRTAYVDTWEYVMPFFTERAAQRYIDENGHNHGGKEQLRIYVESGYRNHEWEAIRRACIAALTPATGEPTT